MASEGRIIEHRLGLGVMRAMQRSFDNPGRARLLKLCNQHHAQCDYSGNSEIFRICQGL